MFCCQRPVRAFVGSKKGVIWALQGQILRGEEPESKKLRSKSGALGRT